MPDGGPIPLLPRALLAGALVAYAAIALVGARWWVSGLAAMVVAILLWWAHPRARFSAYVFFSVVGVRAVLTGVWPAAAFAAGGILLLQTPAARRTWPRLGPSTRSGD